MHSAFSFMRRTGESSDIKQAWKEENCWQGSQSTYFPGGWKQQDICKIVIIIKLKWFYFRGLWRYFLTLHLLTLWLPHYYFHTTWCNNGGECIYTYCFMSIFLRILKKEFFFSLFQKSTNTRLRVLYYSPELTKNKFRLLKELPKSTIYLVCNSRNIVWLSWVHDLGQNCLTYLINSFFISRMKLIRVLAVILRFKDWKSLSSNEWNSVSGTI